MKIKILTPFGKHHVGEIVEAILNPKDEMAQAYDIDGMLWYYGPSSYQRIEQTTENTILQNSLRSILGQDVKLIEFK